MHRPACSVYCLVVLFGCASKEENKAKHLERAMRYVDQNKLKAAVIEYQSALQLDPKDGAVHAELGETYIKLSEGKEAFQAFSRAIALTPKNLSAQVRLGQLFLVSGNTQEARKKAELVLETSPKDVEALSLLAGVQLQENDMNSAIKTLNQTLLRPEDFKAQWRLTRLLVMKGDLDAAIKSYTKTLALDPASSVTYVELAQLYLRKDQPEKAEAELKKMLDAAGKTNETMTAVARFYEVTKQWDRAKAMLLEAVNGAKTGDVGPLMALAAFYARRGDYDKAQTALQEALTIKKDDLNILTGLAQLQFDFKRMNESEATVEKVLGKDKGNPQANFIKGRLLLLKRDFDGAFERFDLVSRERPQNAQAHYFKALALLGKGERKLAEGSLLKALELDPNLIDGRLILAEIYLQDKSTDLASQQIDRLLALAPKDVRVFMAQGQLKLLQRDAKGAEAAFRKATVLKPDFAPAYVRLGMLFNMTDRREEATAVLKEALSVKPNQKGCRGHACGDLLAREEVRPGPQDLQRPKGEGRQGGEDFGLSRLP